jgi:hypothetical protein
MQMPAGKSTCLRSALLVMLVAVTIVATWKSNMRRNSTRLHPFDEQLSPRYANYAIPIVLSELVYKHNHDYTGYSAVSWVFFWDNPKASGKPIRLLLVEATTLAEDAVRSSPMWAIPSDNKGLVDFTWLAFQLFGIHVTSLNSMFFAVLIAGCSLFVIDNFRRPARLGLLVFLLAALSSVSFLVRVTDQFGTVFEPRFFDVLSLIPTIQLLSIISDRRRPSLWLLCLAAGDIFLIVFIYHARATVAWQMILLGAYNLGVWLMWGSITTTSSVFGSICRRATSLVRLGWPSILLAVGLFCLEGYKWLSYHPAYFQKHGTSHAFWHNALMGLVCNPRLAERYGLTLDDTDTVRAVETHLRERGTENTHAAIFGDPNDLKDNFKAFDWVRYEPAARDLYVELWARHPREMALTYVYYKPAALFASFLWAMGWPVDTGTLPAALGSTASDEQRQQDDLYFKPFRWEVVGLVFAALLTALPCLRSEAKSTFFLLAVALVFSAIPGILMIPVIPYVNTTLVLAATLLYMGCAWGVVVGLDLIKKRCEGDRIHTMNGLRRPLARRLLNWLKVPSV